MHGTARFVGAVVSIPCVFSSSPVKLRRSSIGATQPYATACFTALPRVGLIVITYTSFPLSLPLLLPLPTPPPHRVRFHQDTGGAPEAELPSHGTRALHVGGDLEAVSSTDGPPRPSGAIDAAGLAGRDRPLSRPQYRYQVLGCRKGTVRYGAVRCGLAIIIGRCVL